MLDRIIEHNIREALRRSPSVVLTGPRQIGKTTLAISISKTILSIYLDLENRLDHAKVKDIAAFVEENKDKLIILDEVQRLPEIFTQIRGIIDKERRSGNRKGLFLFLGSASLDLLQQSSESLAGRISHIELYPINVNEFNGDKQDKINQLWLRGGFPESLLAKSNRDSLIWRNDFIRTYLERDIPQLGPRISSETLARFWTMLAHNQGTTLNASQLSRSLEVSATTIGRYVDLLVDLLLIRRLKPWRYNVGKRLVKSPKIYVRDSGITHALLNIPSYNDLLGHPVVGGSWEGFVIENIMSVTPVEVQPYFYRSAGGAEIDLILEFGIKEKWAIEIKRSSAPSIPKGFQIACDDIKASKKFLLYSGNDTFSLGGGVTAISLPDLMHKIINH